MIFIRQFYRAQFVALATTGSFESCFVLPSSPHAMLHSHHPISASIFSTVFSTAFVYLWAFLVAPRLQRRSVWRQQEINSISRIREFAFLTVLSLFAFSGCANFEQQQIFRRLSVRICLSTQHETLNNAVCISRAKKKSFFFKKVRLRRSFTFSSIKGKTRVNTSLGFLSRTRDSIINYSGERMRCRVKGSFLNARCGLTDSPPCPPTTPPTLLVHHRHSWRRRAALPGLAICTNSRQIRFYDDREMLLILLSLVFFFIRLRRGLRASLCIPRHQDGWICRSSMFFLYFLALI